VQNWLGTPGKVTLPRRDNIRIDTWLTHDQLQALLAAIPKNKAGCKDFALIATLLVTGYKLQKVRALRSEDFHEESAKSAILEDRIHQVALHALEMIEPTTWDSHSTNVHISDTTGNHEYIFTAFCPRCPREKNRQLSISRKKQPLSPQEIKRCIKRYASLAGLESEWISSETLRRTRMELGETVIAHLVQEAFASRNTGPVHWKRVDRDERLHGIGRRRR
jgi:site-specific recombinase XerD